MPAYRRRIANACFARRERYGSPRSLREGWSIRREVFVDRPIRDHKHATITITLVFPFVYLGGRDKPSIHDGKRGIVHVSVASRCVELPPGLSVPTRGIWYKIGVPTRNSRRANPDSSGNLPLSVRQILWDGLRISSRGGSRCNANMAIFSGSRGWRL